MDIQHNRIRGFEMEYDGTERSTVERRSPPPVSGRGMLRVVTWGLGAGMFGGLIGSLIAFTCINYFANVHTTEKADPVAIANTYIVYTTFVIAAVAAVLTLAGLIFSQHFATDKETHLAHAFDSLLELLKNDEKKAQAAAKQLIIHPDVVRFLEESLRDRVDAEIKRRSNAASTKLAHAKDEHDAVAQLNDELSKF